MKKLLALVLALVMVCSVCACGSSDEGNTTFTVGFDAEFPPYGYKDEAGNYVGFDLDLAQEVCKRRGWEYKAQPIDWDSKDMEINAGTISCIWNGFTITSENKDSYTWTDPYVDNSQVFAVKADSGINSQADLAGKTIVVQAGSSALSAINSDECAELKASFKEVIEVPDYNTAFTYLQSGMAEAVAVDSGVAKYQINERGEADYKVLDEELVKEVYGIGFKKGNTDLRDKIQETLLEMVKDGKFAEIAEKWELTDSVVFGK